MFYNRKVIIGICVVLCAVLIALMICERQAPEAGSELIRNLLGRG